MMRWPGHKWCVAFVVGVLLLFGFFQCAIPYTLFHKEQYSLFLWNDFTWASYWQQDAPAARFLGDFLTQFYYYIAAGPIILSVVLSIIGVLAFIFLRKLGLHPFGAILLSCAVVVWESGRECLTSYPLASTFVLMGLFVLLISLVQLFRRKWLFVPLLLLSFLFIPRHPIDNHWWGMPDRQVEHMLAMDTEAYWGRWNEVRKLTSSEDKTELNSYYHNLSRALDGNLLDSLMNFYQPFERGLFLPVNENGNYMNFTAAGEVWYQLGETTMAEHAAMLGMIFSPHQTGSRPLKRLAEINLINGDSLAAAKYLRLLKQTYAHRRWAEERSDSKSKAYQQLMLKKSILAQSDTIHWTSDYATTLRTLLDSNPSNSLAKDYLLCYDLLTKNLPSFTQDYVKYGNGSNAPVYLQALLIVSATNPESLNLVNVAMPKSVLDDFRRYNGMINDKMEKIQKDFGNTYWFYYQFAKRNER